MRRPFNAFVAPITLLLQEGNFDARVLEILNVFESRDSYRRGQSALDDLAKSVNLSGSRLRHIFKAETGVSWTKFVKEEKIQRALNLLETSHLSVKEVGTKVGMNNESQFIRSFKRALGVTPAKYRSRVVPRISQERTQPSRSQKRL